MKDLDQERQARRSSRPERELEYRLGGHTFRRRRFVRPDLIARFGDLDGRLNSEHMDVLDQIVLGFLEPDSHEAWLELRARDDDPLEYVDIVEFTEQLAEGATGRPTSAPSGSSGGRETTGTSSTDGSGSAAETSTTSTRAAS